jgi:hypothetical protein
MNPKTVLTAADLFVLLDREFRRRKPRECTTCFLQIPYRTTPGNGYDSNWDVVLPQHCAHGCEAVFEDLVQDFQGLYQLKAEGVAQRS